MAGEAMRKPEARPIDVKTTLSCFACFSLILFTGCVIFALSAHAAGRTYRSPGYEPKKQTELCRFIGMERTEEGMACIYERQTGGPNKQIEIDGHLNCLREFHCERLN